MDSAFDTTTPPTSSTKAEAAAVTGLPVEKIGSVRLQLTTLRKQGILIDLNISGTSMFTKLASWAEIGIDENMGDIRSDRLTRGQKFLIPEEQVKRLKSIEARMRQWLDKLSFDVTGFRPYRWVPYTAYEAWSGKWKELIGEFEAVKLDILAHYDEYVDLLAVDFGKVAAAAWASIQNSYGSEYAIIGPAGKRQIIDRDQFTDQIIAAVVSKMPSREKIAASLYADYAVALAYGQEEVAEDAAAAQLKWEKYEVEKAQMAAQKQEAYLQNSILQEQAHHQAILNQIEERAKESKIEAMMQAEAEHARQRLTEMTSPFEEVFSSLRNQLAQDAKEILESVKKNGFVRGKVAERGRGLLEMFDLLAVQNDFELRNKLEQLRQAIGPDRSEGSAAERSTAEISTILEGIQDLVTSAKQDLLSGPSRFQNLDM
jgi:hypothetical protein